MGFTSEPRREIPMVGNRYSSKFPILVLGLALTLTSSSQSAQAEDWPQWAGPTRDFKVSLADDLSETWPESGLKQLWRQPLGLGYSSIAVVGERLYTMDREADTERIVCLSTVDGKTLWAFSYEAPHLDGMRTGYGTGPHGTPLVIDGRLFVVGTTGLLHALNAEDGSLLWQKDLWGELGGTFLVRGYASSPIALGDSVIVTVGGEGQGFMAFDRGSGKELWRGTTFDNSQSSPVLVDVGTADQTDLILVAFVNNEIVAADPNSGKELWRVEHKSGAAYNITTPVFDPKNHHLFISSAYGGGTRALKISRAGAEELWHTGRMKIQFTNIVWLDGFLYGTTGNVGTVILAGVDAGDGKMLWKDRQIRRSQLLDLGQGRLLALSEDGELILARPNAQGVEILSQTSLGESKTWTIPTVIHDRMYLRNEGMISAYSLR